MKKTLYYYELNDLYCVKDTVYAFQFLEDMEKDLGEQYELVEIPTPKYAGKDTNTLLFW